MAKTNPRLAIVIPCFNEQETLPYSVGQLSQFLRELKAEHAVDPASFICCVDDGSSDSTWEVIQELNQIDPCCEGIKLIGNVGHQNALVAGMAELSDRVDCLVTIDADLQDDFYAIKEMLGKFVSGAEVVYGVRESRVADSFFKRKSAGAFYWVMQALGVKSIPQHADFRLVSQNALYAMKKYPERNLFLRGLFPSMGFSSAIVKYERKARKYGETKYPLGKMLSFAWQGITGFSPKPLQLASVLCLGSFLLAVVESIRALYSWYLGDTVQGWASLTIIILFMGSIQLLCIAIIGDYLSKIYTETKGRPRYLIDQTTTKEG